MLADEPTAALDPESGRDGVDLFRRLAVDTQAAIVMVTHASKILDSADRIVHLDDGPLVEESCGSRREAKKGLALPARSPLNWQMLLRIACKKGLVLVRLRPIEPNAPLACLCPGHAVPLAE